MHYFINLQGNSKRYAGCYNGLTTQCHNRNLYQALNAQLKKKFWVKTKAHVIERPSNCGDVVKRKTFSVYGCARARERERVESNVEKNFLNIVWEKKTMLGSHFTIARKKRFLKNFAGMFHKDRPVFMCARKWW